MGKQALKNTKNISNFAFLVYFLGLIYHLIKM